MLRPGRVQPTSRLPFSLSLLLQNDIEALERKQNVPDLVSVAPFVIMSDPVEFRGQTYRPTLFGGPAEFIAGLLKLELADGQLY